MQNISRFFKSLCKGGWVGWGKATLLSLAIEFSLLVGATVGISFLLRVAQPNESEFELTMRLAEGGDTTAQWNLGVMYDTGEGVVQDYREAFKWYTKAAEQGDVDAQNNLGVMYDTGEGVPQDYKEAVKWYAKAAEQGDADAQNNLGVMYDTGEGGSRLQGGVQVVHQGGEQGDVDAQYNLGDMYGKGEGVPQDIRRQSSGTPRRPSREMSTRVQPWAYVLQRRRSAQVWSSIRMVRCCANGQEKAKEWRDKIELTPLQLAEAQSLYTEIYKRIEANRQD